MQSIYLLGIGIKDYGLVAKIAGVHRDTVTDYIKLYNSKGIEGLQQVNFIGRAGGLSPHQGSLGQYFREHPVNSINEGKQRIKELTGIEKQASQVRIFFKGIGMKYRKTAPIPAKAGPQGQASFLAGTLGPLISQAKEGSIHLLFCDSMHCVMGVSLSFVWSFQRVFVKSSPCRQRLNVVGAVNAVTKKITCPFNDTHGGECRNNCGIPASTESQSISYLTTQGTSTAWL